MPQIIPAYVINLDRRPDRWEIISANLDRIGVKAERIPAVDARLLERQEERELDADGDEPHRKVDVGALACAWSHRKAIRAFLDTSAPAALILEDDTELADDTATLLCGVEWWPRGMLAVRLEWCYPVGRKWRGAVPLWPAEMQTPTGRGVHRLERAGGGSCAYIVTRKAAELLLPALAEPDNPVDQMLWNQRRSKIARRFRPYQVVPAMARQRDAAGTDLVSWRRADFEALGKAGRRKRRWAAMPHMARVRLLMLLGLVRRTKVEYAP